MSDDEILIALQYALDHMADVWAWRVFSSAEFSVEIDNYEAELKRAWATGVGHAEHQRWIRNTHQ